MALPRRSQSTEAGFSNQQALLILLIAFPIALIGLGLVITVAMRPQAPQAAQAPAPIEEPAREEETTTNRETPSLIELPSPTPKPLAGQTSGYSNNRSNCWFQMDTGGRLIGNRCRVSQRINANGDKVVDVIEATGLKRTVVLWDNNEAEVFLQEQRYTGNWSEDDDGDVHISLPGGTFAFKPPD